MARLYGREPFPAQPTLYLVIASEPGPYQFSLGLDDEPPHCSFTVELPARGPINTSMTCSGTTFATQFRPPLRGCR
jgi:hypothetical protein